MVSGEIEDIFVFFLGGGGEGGGNTVHYGRYANADSTEGKNIPTC